MATFAVPLSGNKGSASMFLGLRDGFAAAGVDAHFHVFSYYPKRDARIAAELGNVTVHPGHPKDIVVLLGMMVVSAILPFAVPGKWKRAIAALRGCDVVLMIGGTTFADSMLYKVPWNLLAALPGYWLRRPSVFLSQTIGPLRNGLNRALARWTLRRAVAVHGRGRQSESWARGLGIEACAYRPDLSFNMRTPSFDEVADRHDVVGRLREKMRATDRACVGVAPNSIVYTKAAKVGKDYIGFMAGVVRTVFEQGHLPVLIPHSYREDVSKIHNNDRSICRAIIDRLSPEVDLFYVDADLGAAELRAIIGHLHLLVASRFHSMISALATGVPPITYGWGHHKYTEVLDEFGATELYASFKDLDEADFAPKLQAVHARRAELSQRIREAHRTVAEESGGLPHAIVDVLTTG
ncbi:MAG: polysaccharide pyruvyl transferase family protein [Candidatus Krumholzibacteria bacterium]|nr:polysaccharide pyruvyl transferase family protein [Candidatus Krumholzibacteria bacterium]